MIPQGSVLLNTVYFDNLTNAVNESGSCAALQALVTEAFSSIAAMKDAMVAEQAQLNALLALLTVPATNPAAIVTWITNFITHFLTPIAQPAIDYVTQLAALAAAIASLTAAIESAEVRFPSCSITIPSI